MEHDQRELRHHVAVVLLEDVAIDIQLHRVMPVVHVRQMGQWADAALELVLRLQLLRPLPVID
ncbi:MAG: hypothetical protein EBS33_02165, partial [Alphaproteobacteria bacterium]|nr:hypothetical protein [Alphaproteobacteria bacterium]